MATRIPGFAIDKSGKVVKVQRANLDTSAKIRQRKSKRVTVKRPGAIR